MTWYIYDNSKRVGPYSTKRLRQLVLRGEVTNATCVSQDGEAWAYAHEVLDLFDRRKDSASPTRGKPKTRKAEQRTQRPTYFAKERRSNSASHGNDGYFSVLSNMELRQRLLADMTFWMLIVLGVVPLILGSIQSDLQPTAFAVFFAILWGILFKARVLPIQGNWRLLLGTFFFTGVIGLGIVLILSNFMHQATYSLWTNTGSPVAFVPTWPGLVYMIVMVGFLEESCKAIPVLAFLIFSKKRPNRELIVLTGIFSGFGFAAFENIGYGRASGDYFATAGDAGAWVTLRAMSLVFCHGILSGTVAYFMTVGLQKRQFFRYLLVGIITAGTIHGVYNWLTEVQLTIAAAVIAAAWALLYTNILGLESMSTRQGQQNGIFH